MIIVSNTSPLTSLAAIGQFALLQQIFGEVHISEAVWGELNADGVRWPGQDAVATSAWIYRHPMTDEPLVRSLMRSIDQGEAESIALAMRLRADLVILDDRDAREAAETLGLTVTGVLGILLRAKRKELLPLVRPVLDALRSQAGFYLSDKVYLHTLRLAGE
jgi:predicted nucleic acid-binding protein